jgi:L-aminopeptidase/D-esterase-like protein
MRRILLAVVFACLALPALAAPAGDAQHRPRARDLGVPFDGKPGPFNAITDVAGVEVGLKTLIAGDGALKVGEGPVRTGVTAILPRGKASADPVFAAWYALNGTGEMTGTAWVEESGFLRGPIMITNTHSVGAVHEAVIDWQYRSKKYQLFLHKFFVALPVVAETYDGLLNDVTGFHVRKEHAIAAINSAASGAVAEGNVGGGTGMMTYGFKGGTGTASRKTEHGYTVGALVQTNHGARDRFTVAGVPVGREITDLKPIFTPEPLEEGGGSIIVVIATDAPVLPHQLKRIARRVPIGIGRVGGLGEDSSGDIFVAFSTANPGTAASDDVAAVKLLPNGQINELFAAVTQVTEEAILNAMVAAETMTGINGNTVYALPHDRLQAILRKYNRLQSRGER